jgi:hypothetical protein
MTQATINWINSDFHGSPLFLTNPQSFFNDIAKSELKTIVNTYGYNDLLYPFGKQFALNAINSYKSQLADNAAYTLSNVMNSAQLTRYRNDFNYGGWNGFLTNTQYPQNNYLGFNMMATEQLARDIQGTNQNAAQRVQSLLQQGMGFLSPQTCDPNVNASYNNGTNEFNKPSFDQATYMKEHPYPNITSEADTPAANKWQADLDKAKADWAKTNTCMKDGKSGLINTTPGSVAANQIFSAVDTPRQSILADLKSGIAAILDALFQHFLDKGLNALSNSVNPEPTTDNWSYNGNTLDSTDTTQTLNIPQNVSIAIGQTTSTNISGGSGTYSIQPQSNTSKAIATATIDVSSSSGNKLMVKGIASGTTSIIVQDSSSPAQTVTITITVNAMGALAVNPANILTTPNASNSIIATISGGNEPYNIKTNSDQSIAIALVSGTNLIVTGNAIGTTFVDIKDSSTPTKTAHVPIWVGGPNDLILASAKIEVNTGEVSSVSILNGTAPYVVTKQQNIGVATAEILSTSPTLLTITGIASGTTSATVQDSSNPIKIANITITTTAQMGNCHTSFASGSSMDQQTDQKTCTNIMGTWTANSSTGTGTTTSTSASSNSGICHTVSGDRADLNQTTCSKAGGTWTPN